MASYTYPRRKDLGSGIIQKRTAKREPQADEDQSPGVVGSNDNRAGGDVGSGGSGSGKPGRGSGFGGRAGGGGGRFGKGNGFGNGRGGAGRFGKGNGFDKGNNNNNNNPNSNNGNQEEITTDSAQSAGGQATVPPVAAAPQDATSPAQPPAAKTTSSNLPLVTINAPTPAEIPPQSTVDASTVVLVSTITPPPGSIATTSTAFIPLMIASDSPASPTPDSASSQPQKGLGDPASLGPSLSTTASPVIAASALADTSPTTTVRVGNGGFGGPGRGFGGGNRGNGTNGNGFRGPGGNRNKTETGLDPVAERTLISVGSIGGFILLCFISWIVWRTMKRSKVRRKCDGPQDSIGRSRQWLSDRFLANIPFQRSRQRSWRNLDDSEVSAVQSHSITTKTAHITEKPNKDPTSQYYAQEKAYQLPSTKQSSGQTTQLPKLDTKQTQFNVHFSSGTVTPDSAAPLFSHQPQQSFSSTNAAQFGTMGMPPIDTETLRSCMPTHYPNQPQPFNAHNPSQRQIHRASELSSISSGFGDGDIVVPLGNMIQHPPPVTTPRKQSIAIPGRLSWTRESVYTQSSEDLPPRFRTVSSWVNQQIGRVKRAQQGHLDQMDAPPVPALSSHQMGIPGVHNPPVEQSFPMMMGDDEVPRRVYDAVALSTA